MLRFLSRRVVTTLLTLLFVSIVIFIMGRAAGDPRGLILPGFSTPEQWDLVGERLGLEKPLYQQYGMFLRDVFTASFGQSYIEQRPVRDVISERIMPTLQLAAASFVLSLVIGVPLGVFSAVRRGGVLDYVAKVVALIGQASPAFWLGIMFVLIFAVRLGWVPPSGREEWTGIILPTITMGWYFVSANLRLVRSSMLDVLDSEYIKLARAKGVDGKTVVWKHAFRNALIPPLTFAGVTLAGLVSGSVTVETVFAWPGLGQLAVQAVRNSDYAVLQVVVILFTLIYVTAAFLVDVLYAFVDPRIRYAG